MGTRAKRRLQLRRLSEVQAQSWARILILGPAKSGKTTALATSAPEPILIINCDNRSDENMSALRGAALINADKKRGDPGILNVSSIKTWRAAVNDALDMAEEGECQTVGLDTITLLGWLIHDELKESGLEGYDLWGEFLEEMMNGISRLLAIDAHLIVNGHALAGEDTLLGMLPSMPGKAAGRIPAMIDDWIWLDSDPKSKPERAFLVGPQRSWNHGARNAKRTVRMDANVTELIEELGLEP